MWSSPLSKGKIPISVATIEAFFDAFAKSSSKEQHGFARVVQRVFLTKPPIRNQVRYLIQNHPFATARNLHLKILQFRGTLLTLGKRLYPLDRFTQGLLNELIEDGGLNVSSLDPKALSTDQLKFLMKAERVHPIERVEDLQRRLIGNRKGFALWHHRFEPFPLAMVYVALEQKFFTTLEGLFKSATSKPPSAPTHAIFYSISLGQLGGKGLGLGRHLLLNTFSELRRQHTTLCQFQTLSPITRFDEWLQLCHQDTFETVHDYTTLAEKYIKECYKRKSRIVDPVAAFHFANGAILDRILPDANPKSTSSFGLMASYRYELDRLEERSQAYKRAGVLKSSKL